MALFPKCGFRLHLSDGVVVPGARLDGLLELIVPEDIPRAERVELTFRSRAWAGYGSGKSRNVTRRDLFIAPLRIELPQSAALARGEYRYPFDLDVPAWLPPGLTASDCAIEHAIETRLDVDWAIDPVARLNPTIVLPAGVGERTPVTVRSPGGFHESVVVEISLASTLVAADEPLIGHVALRSGHTARFDAVELALVGVATIRMGRGDRRQSASTKIIIPAAALRSGQSVPFTFPADVNRRPTFRNGFIDHDLLLRVTLDVPWAFDPHFEIPLHVLPAGSTVHGQTAVIPVGGERLRAIAAAVSQATGLRVGRHPTLVEGRVGPVGVRISDGPRDGRLGVEVDFELPDAELGVAFRPLGMLEGFRQSPLLPASLAPQYLLRFAPEEASRPKVPEEALRRFASAVLDGLEGCDEVRFSDHHLGVHYLLPNDGTDQLLALAGSAMRRAEAIAAAIAALPFPAGLEGARPAWEAAAALQEAVLVPSGPSLHGLSLSARVLGGDERRIGFSLRTVFGGSEPSLRVDVDLSGAPLPPAAAAELGAEAATPRLQRLRGVFPVIEAVGRERATLERPGFPPDPRTVLAELEPFFWWLLEARGERRADQPYR